MDPLKELPMGFGMALAQNQEAMAQFSAMTEQQQQELIEKTHSVCSKEEMQALVSRLVQ